MNALEQPLKVLPDNTRRLIVAFSGGRDSAALLHAAKNMVVDRPLYAVHVCHHLESEAEQWAAHCARQCEALGIAFVRHDVSVDPRLGGLEAAARRQRYDVLAAHSIDGDVVVCAHHARDQAETFLLQGLRGAGSAGLAGMPVLAGLGKGRIWRPWLGIDRDMITAYARTHALDWIEDRSNRDLERGRGYIRRAIWPALETRWPAAAQTLSRSARWAAEAAEAIDTLTAIDSNAARDAFHTVNITALEQLPRPRAARVVKAWLADNANDPPDHRHIDQILNLMNAREHASPRVVFARTEVRRFDGRFWCMSRLTRAPSKTREPIAVETPTVALPPGCGDLLVHEALSPTTRSALSIRFRRGGERIVRADGQNIALSEWLRARRIPPWIRERLPLVYRGDTLIAVADRWQHPSWEQWPDVSQALFEWRHDLVGDIDRIACPANDR